MVAGYRSADVARAGTGALLGILVSGLTALAIPNGNEALPFIIAPMGATAVLLFAVPGSPLAQPWPVLGGNLVSTAVGLVAHWLIGVPAVAAAVGVGVAISVMMLLRCLHPPGGACALLAATATPAIDVQGLAFIALPVAVNTVALLAVALVVNNLTGFRYPHRPPPVPQTASPTAHLGVQMTDVDEAMRRAGQGLDVSPGDVLALVREAETRALNRRLGSLRVSQIMRRDVATVLGYETIYRARLVIVQRHVKSLPVIDDDRHVIGILSITDLFNRDIVELKKVQTVMKTDVVTLPETAEVAELIPFMTETGYRHMPIVDADDRLVGMVTRGELIAVLHRMLLGEIT